ncbi:hypothetical protein N9N03_00935 [Chlamydiia bacterium]|nr:hypothetical protein [Chlamydiia bacterium]
MNITVTANIRENALYSSSISGTTLGATGLNDTTKDALWNTFLNLMFSNADLATDYNEATLTFTGDLAEYNDYEFMLSVYKAAIRSFIFEKKDVNGQTDQLTTANFTTWLNEQKADTNSVFNQQNSIMLYVWFTLLASFKEMQKTAINHIQFSLAMAGAERHTINDLAGVGFTVQDSESDFDAQKTNMQSQQDMEKFKQKRTLLGKKGQAAQSFVSSSQEAVSGQSQLLNSIMQQLDAIISGIIRR